MAELAGDVQEGLLAMTVAAGLQVMAAIMNADVEAVCGPTGRHDLDRTAVRHGAGDGSVTLGGAAGAGDPAADACHGRLRRAAGAYLRAVLLDGGVGQDGDGTVAGRLSSRRYPVGLEPVGQKVERVARSTSKSAVSRRVVAATETALAELHAAPLDGLDGGVLDEHLVVVLDDVPADRSGGRWFQRRVRGVAVGPVQLGLVDLLDPWEQ
jgi:putative transposase